MEGVGAVGGRKKWKEGVEGKSGRRRWKAKDGGLRLGLDDADQIWKLG